MKTILNKQKIHKKLLVVNIRAKKIIYNKKMIQLNKLILS